MSFKDHFSGHAADLRLLPAPLSGGAVRFRDLPPPPGARSAWDCATGNGQAAVDLAAAFRAGDRDRRLRRAARARAMPHPKIEYRQAPAEESGLASGTVDLVTVATAVHWFDFDRFYAEVERVLAPGGALAVWAYNLARVDPEVDVLIDRLAREIVGPYWPPERRWVDEDYRTLPFPFDEVEVPQLWIEERWDLDRLIHYFRTWSATARYQQATGRDPAARDPRADARARLGRSARQVAAVRWPVMMRRGSGLGSARCYRFPCSNDHGADQPQGRGRQDHHRRQPLRRPGGPGAARAAGGPGQPGLGLALAGGRPGEPRALLRGRAARRPAGGAGGAGDVGPRPRT